MVDSVNKKRKVSKKTKRSWRKHVDIQDVNKFLENQRLEERLGVPFSQKPDEELFVIDTSRKNVKVDEAEKKPTKKEYRELLRKSEPKCYAMLKSLTAVPDPIKKRNVVNKKPVQKKRKEISSGIIKKSKRKILTVNEDLWEVQDLKGIDKIKTNEWYTNDTIRHTFANTGNIKKKLPSSLHKKTSVLPAINAPHPGTSYNPSYKDHQDLLQQVAADELKLIKEEEHLNRVTNKMFRKVSQDQMQKDKLIEMSEGLPLTKEEDEPNQEDEDSTVKSINPPVQNNKKTLKQRRKIKETQQQQLQNLKKKIEKKKVADIYKLKKFNNQIMKAEKKQELSLKKKSELKIKKSLQPKTLSRIKFEALEQEFQIGDELTGSLRNSQPTGNLLKDRFKSLQQRNLVNPTTLVLKRPKAKVKKYIKADHKYDFTKIQK